METQAVFQDICPFFGDTYLSFWIKSMGNEWNGKKNYQSDIPNERHFALSGETFNYIIYM